MAKPKIVKVKPSRRVIKDSHGNTHRIVVKGGVRAKPTKNR